MNLQMLMSPAQRTIRCSSLPLLMACPQSATRPAVPISGVRGPADLGTATHKVLLSWIAVGRPEWGDVHVEAGIHEVEAKDLGRLCGLGWRLWQKIEQYFPSPRIEREFSADLSPGVRLVGHTDVISTVRDDELRICDLKTGFLESDWTDQITGYALTAAHEHGLPKHGKVVISILHVQNQTITAKELSWSEMLAWGNRLVSRLASPEFVTGPHCIHCRRALECPALEAQESRARKILADAPENQSLADVYLATKLMEALVNRALGAVRAKVSAAGPQDLGDGRWLVLEDTHRPTLNYASAKPILLKQLDQERIDELLWLGKGEMQKALAELVPRGSKGAFISQVFDELEEAGAITYTVSRRLTCRRGLPNVEVKRNGDADTGTTDPGSEAAGDEGA